MRAFKVRAAAVACLLSAKPGAAGADASSAVAKAIVLDAPTCETPSFSSAEFRRLLGIELTGDRLKIQEAISRENGARVVDELVIRVPADACRADASEVVVALRSKTEDGVTQRVVRVSMADVSANARPRTLALAVAELIREIRQRSPERATADPTETSVPPPLADAPVESKQPPSPPPATDDARHADDIALGATWRLFTSARTSLLGGQLSGTVPLPLPGLRLRGDLGGAVGTVTDPLGSVQISILSAGIAALLMTEGRPTLVLGPRLEIGYSYGGGATKRTATTTRGDGSTFIGASLLAGVRAPVLGPLSATLEIEMGAALRGQEVFANDRLIASTTGPFAGARAGIAYVY